MRQWKEYEFKNIDEFIDYCNVVEIKHSKIIKSDGLICVMDWDRGCLYWINEYK